MNLKTFFLYIVLLSALVSCHQTKTSKTTKNDEQKKEQVVPPASPPLPSDTSSYDSPRFADRIKEQAQQLMKMNDAGLFDKLHQKLTTTLSADQKDYFLGHPNLAVLAIAKGNIFENGPGDLGYTVYNKGNHRIEITLFDHKSNTYNTLYKELKVVNTLQNLDCSSSFGSLDYLVASELIDQEDYIRLNNSNYLIDDNSFDVTDISTNKNFDLQQGCL
ncbi:MAG: hypothetical protein ACN6PI_25435, partial [Sphingobacterium siyangense]